MEITATQTLAGLNYTTWHILGWEETRATYNQLLRRGQLAVLEYWIDLLYTVSMHYMVQPRMPPNFWHWGGIAEVLDYSDSHNNACRFRLQPIPNYLDYQSGLPDLRPLTCDYCGHHAASGYAAADMVQEATFCSLEHAAAHRRALFQLVPLLQEFYYGQSEATQPALCPHLGRGPYPGIQCHAHWYLRPLPTGEQALQQYLEALPRPDLEHVVPFDWGQYQPTPFIPRKPKNRSKPDGETRQSDTPPATESPR